MCLRIRYEMKVVIGVHEAAPIPEGSRDGPGKAVVDVKLE